jgi:hypothetical protein
MESPPVTGFRGGAFDKKVKGFDFFGQTFDFLIWGALTCRFGERRHTHLAFDLGTDSALPGATDREGPGH